MYRSIETSIWTDPKFRALPREGKLLFLYLITNPHAHLSGMYYLPRVVLTHETGLAGYPIDTLWDTLSDAGMARNDPEREVVWVVNMLKYQGRGEKIQKCVKDHLSTLHKTPLIKDFRRHYPEIFGVAGHTPSIPHRYPIDGASVQEQEKEQEKGIPASGDAAPAPKPKKPKAAPTGDHAALVAHFCEGWKAAYGTPYPFKGGQDGSHIKWILSKVDDDLPRAMKVIDAYLANREKWYVDKCHPLGRLVSDFQKFVASGPPKSAPVQLTIHGEV